MTLIDNGLASNIENMYFFVRTCVSLQTDRNDYYICCRVPIFKNQSLVVT